MCSHGEWTAAINAGFELDVSVHTLRAGNTMYYYCYHNYDADKALNTSVIRSYSAD